MSKVIGWVAVRFNQDNIVDNFGAGRDVSHNLIVISKAFWGAFKA